MPDEKPPRPKNPIPNSRPFQKGNRVNPGGRPKAAGEMVRLIREMTGNGQELVEFAISVMRGKVPGMKGARSREYAHTWLSDRGLGKPVQDVDVLLRTVEASPEMQAALAAIVLSPHERRERIAELRERLALSAPAPPPKIDDADLD